MQDVVDFLRVDVDAAGDDQLGGAAGEEEIAVGVEIAHVADGEVVASLVGRARLFGVAEIFEAVVGVVPEEDRADLIGRAVAAFVVEDAGPEGGIELADAAGLLRATPPSR